jgi:hypothetical protein
MINNIKFLTKLFERQNKCSIIYLTKAFFFFRVDSRGSGAGKGREGKGIREREREEEEERGRACSSAVLLHAHAALEMAAMACLAPGNGCS